MIIGYDHSRQKIAMTNSNENNNDPMEFFKNMWGNMGFALPGMVTPTVDTNELSKRITDLKAVEGWLKSNLSLLQMTIQGLEMQRTTLNTLQQMSQAAQQSSASDGGTTANPFLNPATWPMPWNLMGDTPQAPTVAAASTASQSPSANKTGEPDR
jgi:hypothetical protein